MLAATAIIVTALTDRQSRQEPVTKATQPEPQTTPPTPPTTARSQSPPAMTSDGSYAVGTTTLPIVEPGGAGGTADRSLPTAIFYPGREAAAGEAAGVQPDRSHAPYPLLVFSQGYDLSVQAYSTLLRDWASAGFVVAAPTYPHTDPGDPGALDENDIITTPPTYGT